jgi:hypothetical protein
MKDWFKSKPPRKIKYVDEATFKKAVAKVKRLFTNRPPRDPARIPRILELIRKHWEEYPDLRLTQIIGNCFGPGDHYYKEDSDLEAALLKGARSKGKDE